MDTVDVPMRFVQVSPQVVSVSPVESGTANGCTTAFLYRVDLLRDVFDVLVQRRQQLPRLGCPRVLGHSGIVSSADHARDRTPLGCS